MAFAGIDVGTSGCKILVYDLEGTVLYQSSTKYKELGEDGYREISPIVIWDSVQHILKDVGKNCKEKVEALAVTTLGESIVCLDKKKQSLCYSMVTGDKRGIAESKRLIQEVGAQRILDITGLSPSEMYGLPKYMWLNEHTDFIRMAESILFYEDFVGYMLTNKRMVSYSSASRSMAFDINQKTWSEELLNHAGIKAEQMSTPVDAGTVIGKILPEMAEKLSLNPDMLIVAGGHDQSCAALGSGLNNPATGECGMGTCEFIFMRLPGIKNDYYMIEHDFTCVPYVLSDAYLTSLEITTCGILKNWCKDTILHGIDLECRQNKVDFFSCMDEKITNLETEVLVLPQFGSSGNPDINYDVTGTITGLTIHTKPEEIYQAVLEGMAFQQLMSYEKVQNLGAKMEEMICTGGGAKSKVTLQMRADIFGIDIATITSEESGTLGCMILAAVGTGNYASIEEAISKVVHRKEQFHPNPAKAEYYGRKYKKFKMLYEAMHLW